MTESNSGGHVIAGRYQLGGASCVNCSNLNATPFRVREGGGYDYPGTYMRAAYRGPEGPDAHHYNLSLRCARATQPLCTDGLKNGLESDTDRNGSQCPPCAKGQSCNSTGDCGAGLSCSAGKCALPASCQAQHTSHPADPSAVYSLDPDGAGPGLPFNAYCDMSTDGGGWTLALAYAHPGGQNDALVPGTVPTDPISGYSHMSMAQMQSLGSVSDARFYCQTSAHARKIHFKTSSSGAINYIRGTGSNTVAYWTSGTIALAGHTANLPAVTTTVFDNSGEDRMTSHLFYKNTPSLSIWNIRYVDPAIRWECDDYHQQGDVANTTLHQIWVR